MSGVGGIELYYILHTTRSMNCEAHLVQLGSTGWIIYIHSIADQVVVLNSNGNDITTKTVKDTPF